jgi:hypothetical protein
MTELASINISQALACDDIRQEANGKHILIGVYSGNMGLQFFPTMVALGFWALAKPSRPGDYHVQLRVQAPGGKEATRGEMIIHVHDIEDSAIVIPPMPIGLDEPGLIQLQYREGSGEWRTICSIDARLVPPPPPIESLKSS